ncbi:hypothetical protein ACFO4P_16920 [Epilithonimonas pallida]|uniref:Uncharacterized protein n=1 Tax=Epilithonimonas pallida TaxID=373671 RepID=A0ABY1R4S2_9FLAO|nr:hypothetical protein [Epilithonimonas pallida]SMP94666.1 hypothetical protein SAMN05421679_10669 [Epilithonimonas pallida]
MAKNKLGDLNDHLFAQIERLNDETLTPEQMELELKKAEAMESVAKQIIDVSKTVLDASQLKFKILEKGYQENSFKLLD